MGLHVRGFHWRNRLELVAVMEMIMVEWQFQAEKKSYVAAHRMFQGVPQYL